MCRDSTVKPLSMCKFNFDGARKYTGQFFGKDAKTGSNQTKLEGSEIASWVSIRQMKTLPAEAKAKSRSAMF